MNGLFFIFFHLLSLANTDFGYNRKANCVLFMWKYRIVGMAGIGESLLLVTFCGLCTFLTSVSLSAIATNGAMKVKEFFFVF